MTIRRERSISENRPELDWPLAPSEQGREVWYLLVTSRDRTVAFWYHLELVATAAGWQEGRSWAAITDRAVPERSHFVSRVVRLDSVRFQDDPFALATDAERLTDGATSGEISASDTDSGAATICWELAYEPDQYSFRPLRSQCLTEVLSKVTGSGKHWSCNQSVSMTGTVTVGERTIEFADAPGHQGHTVAGNPEKITWVHCNDFQTGHTGIDHAVLEALQYDELLSLCLRLDGTVHAFNRPHHILPASPFSNTVTYNEVGHWQFERNTGPIPLQVTVDAPAASTNPDCWQRTRQYLPSGQSLYDAHCPFGSLELVVRSGQQSVTLTSDVARVEWIRPDPPLTGEFFPLWD